MLLIPETKWPHATRYRMQTLIKQSMDSELEFKTSGRRGEGLGSKKDITGEISQHTYFGLLWKEWRGVKLL